MTSVGAAALVAALLALATAGCRRGAADAATTREPRAEPVPAERAWPDAGEVVSGVDAGAPP